MQVATLFRESTSLLGSSAGMEAGAAATTNTTVTSSGSSSSVASPPEPGSAIPIAGTAPTGPSVLTTPLSATSTPPPPPISSSPPLPTVVSSPTASTSSSSSSSSASSSSSSSASSASSCTPPNSNCSSGPTTTTSTPSSAPPPPPPSSPPTTPTLAAASEQQHSQEQQIEQPSPLSPPQQEQLPIMSQPEERDACHPHDTCHDACHDACHDSSAVPLNLCPTSLSVHVGYDFATNNPNHPANYSNKYKMNMKLEREDDGYETANSLPPRGVTAEGGGSSGGGEIKCEKLDDPYSFIDDDPMPIMTSNGSEGVLPPHPIHMQQQPPLHHQQQQHSIHGQHQMPGMGEGGGIGSAGSDGSDMLGTGGQPPYAIDSGLSYHYHIAIGPKKRGRKKKVKSDEPEFTTDPNGATIPRPPKERKKHDRFNGMPEEEVSKRTLPDHITSNLDIIIIGINPGLFAAYKGHHYAGPGNHFWKCLYLSGLTQQQMSADEDYKLLQVGIGFTNMVARATKGSADLTRKEIKDGSQILLEKIKKYQPKIAVFNGKLIYEVFSGKKDFNFGRQPDLVEGTNTYMWVMPSSSARCAQLPRAADKVPFYAALKKFRDYLNGLVASIDDAELVFTEPRVKSCYEAEPRGDPLLFPSEPLTDVGDDSAIINRDEDGTVVNSSSGVAGVGSVQGLLPNKKKRGRPKKVKVEGGGEDGGGSGAAPVVKPAAQPRRNNNSTNNANNANNCDFPKKKRGRPKKVKVALTDEETDINISANLLRNSGGSDLNSHGVQLGMGVGALSGHHPMLHASPLALDNGTNNNHLSTKCFSSPSPIQSPPPHHFYHHHQQQQQQQQHHPHLQHHHQQQQQQLYGGVGGYCLSPRPSHPHTPVQLYSSAVHTTPNHNSSNSSQSPRPQSQPFTHSDLSSEISAAISSSEQLGSPPPSPGMIGAPDFEPPTNMAEDDGGGGSSSVHGDSGSGGPGGASSSGNGPGSSGGECCRLSPATTPNSVPVEQQQHYSGYHTAYGHHHHHQQQQQFHVGAGMDHPGPSSSVGVSVPPPPAPSTPEHHQQQQQQSPQPQVAHQQHTQDIAAKSLSGLESLVDQIPSITDGEATVLNEPTDYSTHQFAHGHGHQYSGTMSRAATGSPVSDMGVGAATLYGYGSGGSGTVAGAVSSYHHHPHQHLPAALYPTPSWATASSYDSPHVPLPYQPSVYGHGPPPVGVGVPPPPPHHHQGAYGAPGAAGIHVPSPNYPSPYYGYPPQTHHHHGYHHHHHHPSYLGGF